MDGALALALGVLAAVIVVLPLALWQHRRLAASRVRGLALEAEVEKGRRMLAAAPDGLYVWDDASGTEHCSRRLAVLLDLASGTEARFEDVLYRFSGDAAAARHQAVIGLRREGTGFDLAVTTAGGRRSVHAVGVRCGAADGRPLADLLWMRDADAAAGEVPVGGDAEAEAKRVHALLDALPVPVWLRDADLELAFANRASGDGAVAEAGRDLAVRARDGGAALAEPRLVSVADAPRLFEITEAPVPGQGYTIGIAIDRSAAEETEGEFSRQSKAQAEILESLRTAMAIYGSDTRLKYFNTAYAELWHLETGWLATEPDLSQVLERLREQRRLPEYADFRAFKGAQLARFKDLAAPVEDLMHLPDGTTLNSVVSQHPLGGLVFAYEDVTDRLALERSFNTLIAVQQETLDNLYEGVAVFGSDGRMKLSNPAFAKLWNLGEIPGPDGDADAPHVSQFVEGMRPYLGDVEDWPAYKQRVTARLMSREAASGRLVRGDGTVLEYANVPLPDGAVLLSYLDVTDRFRVEQALRQRAEAMTEADRLKSEFIANVSHEIRTPLTTITGFAEILAGEHFGTLNERQAEYSRCILESSRGLMSLIGDILDWATIEAGMMTLQLDAVELHSSMAGVFALIRERARHKGLKLAFDCPPDIGWIVGDEKRLKQVVFNLLSNAVQFTPPQGTVGLAAERRDSDVVIAVSDTGVGVPQADQERVFGTFERAAEGEASQAGSGLGLSLVKRFIELHGGHVEMRSAPGRGTTVTCTIPAGGE